MRKPGRQEEVREPARDVTVTSHIELDMYKYPSLVFDIESNRDEPAEVDIRQTLPEGMAMSNVGFHTDFGEEYWETDGSAFEFRYTLDPGEAYTTVLGFCSADIDITRDILEATERVDVEPLPEMDRPSPGVDRPSPEKDQPSPVLTRSAEHSPYSGPAESQTDGGPDIPSNEDESTGGDGETPSETDSIGSDRSLVDRLAAQIENGEASTDSVIRLRESLAKNADPLGSHEARLRQVEDDVSSLRAYTNALESFLDENGSGADLLAELESRIDLLETEVNDVESTFESLSSAIESVNSEVDELEREVNRTVSESQEIANTVESHDARIESVERELPEGDLEERVDELAVQVESLDEFVQNLKSAFM